MNQRRQPRQSPSERVTELVKARDTETLKKEFLLSTVIALSAVERDKIAVTLAETFPLDDGLRVTEPKEFFAYLQANPGAGQHPALLLKSYATEIVTVLAEQRLLTDFRVLPGLITALAHPSFDIARDAHRSLVALTGHNTGTVHWPYWPHVPKDVPARAEVLAWWRNWWAKNKERQPIFTPALEARLKQVVSRMATALVTDLKGKPPERFLELTLFTVRPDQVERRDIDFFPLYWSRPALPSKEALDIFIRIQGRFGMPDLASAEDARSRDRDPLSFPDTPEVAGLRAVRQTLYGGYLPGTDLRVEVEMATHNTALINAARVHLTKVADAEGMIAAPRIAREPNTSQPPATLPQPSVNDGGIWAFSSGPGKVETPEETAQRQRLITLSDAVDNADVKAVERAFAGGARYPASDLGGMVITCIGEAYDPLRPDNDPKRERFRTIAKFLLRQGANPNERDGNDGTALHHAAMYGDVEICTLLLDRKADLYARDKVEETPLSTAAIFNQAKVVELLIKRGVDLRKYGREALWAAAYNDGYETVEVLVRHGVDITARDPKGRTAEALAKERGFTRTAQRIAALARATRRQPGKGKSKE